MKRDRTAAAVCRCNGKCDGSCLRWPMKPAVIAICAAISLSACAVAVAPVRPEVMIDCGTLSGAGDMAIDFDGKRYFGRIDCGRPI